MAEAIILVPEAILPSARAAVLDTGTALAVSADRISGVGPTSILMSHNPAALVINLPGCVLMPGLVNAHQHGRGLSQIQLGYPDNFLEIWISNRRGRGVLDA